MKRKRLKPDARKNDVLSLALRLAATRGYNRITRDQVAKAAGVTGPALTYHFGSMGQFRRQLMRLAVSEGCLAVVAQGLAAGDPQALKAPESLRRRAVEAMLSPNCK